ncbi:GNAT family N-acetyltransferase [Ureibacillus sinduriensis]|uniref:GNAT family acetyltransferase n=1 Tax=Ureibacillus sinduriensis BLB-1 = JCM 15800 TaxID=1384057 RepID=A0A0A3IMV6_9BACL|nr:GNAT family N-acetyltransferase [Ureibacillus sinduriensis]KGR76172.1 GNAT family acetyltransferase [Ureibacillus sinduriensis BLB-1 = JCM 15800]
MIRAFEETDMDTLVDIWYKGSLQAHHFIEADYWKSQMEDMKQKYIPMSETHVLMSPSGIVGFISMVDNYLAALFIDVAHQNKGAGKELLDFEKNRKSEIHLKVYKENSSAVRFYEKNGFVVKEELTDEQTKQPEYLMVWSGN